MMNATSLNTNDSFIGCTCDKCGHFTKYPSLSVYDHSMVVCPPCSKKLNDEFNEKFDLSYEPTIVLPSGDLDVGMCQNCGAYYNYIGEPELCSICVRI